MDERNRMIHRELAGGLILRSLSAGTPADRQNLPQFYVDVFTDAYGPDDHVLGPWTENLLSEKHPTITADDVFVVVDPAHDERIVSAVILIPQVWRYATIEIPFGRVELVGTHKDYRRRGLVRSLFDAAHDRSTELGHIMQGVTGIPHFYRQFGYAMAVELGSGPTLPIYAIPKLKEDEKPAFTLVKATEEDLPQLMEWERQFATCCLLSVVRDEKRWLHDMSGRQRKTVAAVVFLIIKNAEGQGVGYVCVREMTYKGIINCFEYVVDERTSYLATFDDVVRGIRDYADQYLIAEGEEKTAVLAFDTGLQEVLYPFVQNTWLGKGNPSNYAWYLRVPDLPQFIHHITPLLEKRLVGSRANCYSGELALDFRDKTGLTLKFEQGRLCEVSAGAPAMDKDDASFPWHTFLNLLFGHRTIAEMQYILPDVYANQKATVLLEALFPRQRSWLMAQA